MILVAVLSSRRVRADLGIEVKWLILSDQVSGSQCPSAPISMGVKLAEYSRDSGSLNTSWLFSLPSLWCLALTRPLWELKGTVKVISHCLMTTITGMAVVPRISERMVEGGLSVALRLETSAICLLLNVGWL